MKQIVKKFNNLLKKTIFKVQNKTNNKLRISSFNKYLITFIGLLFFYLFYLLTPLLYEKTWVQNKIESKFLNEFKLNLSTSADISYRILPAPHFLVKNSKLSFDGNKNQKSIADIRSLKFFLSRSNFFNKEKMNVKKVIIDNANFSFLRSDISTLNKFSDSKFSNKKIKINNSKIFFKDNLNEIITIIKMDKSILFFDNVKLLNLFKLNGVVFGVPFIFNLNHKNDSINNKTINLAAKSLKLNIFNEFFNQNSPSSTGRNIISISKTIIKTKYEVKEKVITFVSDNSKSGILKIDFNGKLSINPFDLYLDIILDDYKISKLFKPNAILNEFFKSKLLFNDNLSVDLSFFIKTSSKDQIFNDAKINFNISNGKFNFDKSIFVNNNIGLLELNNSNLLYDNSKFILNTDIWITIKDSDQLFSFLNTRKKSRKKIENILINLDYDFLNSRVKFNTIKIDNKEVNDQFLSKIETFNDHTSNNMIKSRRLINELLSVYEG